MTDDIMAMIWGRPVRQTKRRIPRKRAQYRDPMTGITRTTTGAVQAMVGVTVGTTLLGAIKGMR